MTLLQQENKQLKVIGQHYEHKITNLISELKQIKDSGLDWDAKLLE